MLYSDSKDRISQEGDESMVQSIISVLIVLACGYIGCFMDTAGCIIASAASATGCIVYAILHQKKG